MKNVLILLLLLATNTFSQEMKNDWANVSRYSEENKPLMVAANTDGRVVFMGNSITEGWKNANPDFFRKNNFINRGIGGQVTSQMLVRFRPDVIELRPKIVVILAGVNDIAQNNGPISLETIFGNIISMVELSQANQIVPVICSVLPAESFPWRKEIQPSEKIIELNKMLEMYAKDHQLTFVDYHLEMKNASNGLPKEWSTDGVHLNKKGYEVMQKILMKKLEPLLTKN